MKSVDLENRLYIPAGFDADWYLAQYPDVEMLGMDPLEHYLWLGCHLGRKAGPNAVAAVNDAILPLLPITSISSPSIAGPTIGGFSSIRLPAEFIGEGSAAPETLEGLSVAIHAHMYYPDLAPEFAQYMGEMPCRFDLYVSVPNSAAQAQVIKEFQKISNVNRLDVRIVPNVGRDLGPFVVEFGQELAKYDICGHIQSKKSLYNKGATDGWRQYVIGSLFDKPERISFFLNQLKNNKYGIIYPQTYYNIPYMAHTWLANSGLARHFGPRFGVENIADGYFDFPAGSMFWAKTDAIRPLLEAGLDWSDFPPEKGQTDGTLAHCIERMLGVVPTARRFQHGVIRDSGAPSWSRWRFSQYLDRPLEHIHEIIADPKTKVVTFDIFDTLLTRPLLDADYVKRLLDGEYARKGFRGFHNARASHEGAARNAKGSDVDIHEIYQSIFGALGREDIIRKEREIDLEINIVRPRTDIIELFNLSRRLGKRVVLASDMFLPRNVIETMLDRCGIGGWDHFYLSCEVGVRKDSGRLYEHILVKENISSDEMLMIGDNERSDFQIPSDMGIRTIHVMKPVNLLRSIPRFADIVPDAYSANMGEQFVFGAIASENFSAISFPEFSADDMFGSAQQIGYGLLGPIILAFCQWLERRVAEDKLDCLHFLAREGKFLKRAFDFWQRARQHPVRTEYLLISRRAATVPCITSLVDALDIAQSNNFYGANMDAFLIERFGVTLGEATWTDVEKRKIWQRSRPLEIRDGDITHIEPFLSAIFPEILAQAEAEHQSALSYFASIGLGDEGGAIVDVGYGGTIQRHLAKLLNRNISGLYMITDENGHDWGRRSGMSIRGCFAEGESRSPSASPMFLNSFLIEKMLSANDQQVMRYTPTGSVEFRNLPDYVDDGCGVRLEMQDAAMKFIKDAVRVRDELEDFEISTELCQTLFNRFSLHLSTKEEHVFKTLALDDFYCGRGIVS